MICSPTSVIWLKGVFQSVQQSACARSDSALRGCEEIERAFVADPSSSSTAPAHPAATAVEPALSEAEGATQDDATTRGDSYLVPRTSYLVPRTSLLVPP